MELRLCKSNQWVEGRFDLDLMCTPGGEDLRRMLTVLTICFRMRRLAEAEKDGTMENLKVEVKEAVKKAYDSLRVPEELKQAADGKGGFSLYLSGGGFRGWGYVLMSRHRVQPYPIPVINGFKATREEFMGTEDVEIAAAATLQNEDDEIFRVSDRRASQVPAVAFLINAFAEALPHIKEARFCQGGVREGYLFTSFTPQLQGAHPLVVASRSISLIPSRAIFDLLMAAIPHDAPRDAQNDIQTVFNVSILQALANLMYYHSSHSKDLQASAALRSTTSGILAGVHGIPHEDRTLLALLLCARWGGEVPPNDEAFKRSLERLVESQWTLWWINYFGFVAALIAAIFPAGTRGTEQRERLRLEPNWNRSTKGEHALCLRVDLDAELDPEMFTKEVKGIDKVGKKKNWIGGKDGVGYKVVVETATLPA